MKNFNFQNRIFPSITGEGSFDWAQKLEEVNNLGLKEVCVFLERFDKKERDNLYRLLLKSAIKEVPFAHLRHDMDGEEIDFFIENYKTKYFNAHESDFLQEKWKDYRDKIYLEMDFNDKVERDVKVSKAAGFCVDLAHFKAALSRGTKEAAYTYFRKNRAKFDCNHLGGYDPEKGEDMHVVSKLSDFDYLTALPKFLFGKVLAIEVDNPIREQLEFKEYIVKILNEYFQEERE